METPKAKYFLSIRDSKAVHMADIALDNLTVLTGVNASGKSTIARMLHEIVNLSAIYPVLLRKNAWVPVKDWATQIVRFKDRLESKNGGVLSAVRMQTAGMEFESRLETEELGAVLNSLELFSHEVFEQYGRLRENADAKRAYMAFVRAVGVGEEYAADMARVTAVFEMKKMKCSEVFEQKSRNRSYEVYNHVRELKYDISWLTDSNKVELYEDGEPVYAVHTREGTNFLDVTHALKELYGLRHSFYIASPWVAIPQPVKDKDGELRIRYDDFPHLPVRQPPADAQELFAVLGGEVEVSESTGEKRWVFKSPSFPRPIDLSDCATGIKSLAILNILYKGGYLDDETLLIIDEPEVHLHPQWVFEYARILVLIAKRLKARIFVTSHDPDMISALKVVSEAEKLDGVRFYLSNEAGLQGRPQYDYESLGMNIEKIFRRFNVALDRIDTYGGKSAQADRNDDFE